MKWFEKAIHPAFRKGDDDSTPFLAIRNADGTKNTIIQNSPFKKIGNFMHSLDSKPPVSYSQLPKKTKVTPPVERAGPPPPPKPQYAEEKAFNYLADGLSSLFAPNVASAADSAPEPVDSNNIPAVPSPLARSMRSSIAKEENRQKRKIHQEEIDEEEHGVEHEYDHGINRHKRKILSLVDKELKENGEHVWDRMDRYTQKELDAIEKQENEQASRIHRDHTGPGVPKFVGKYSHGIKKNKKELKRKIKDLREQEKEEVKDDIAKSIRRLQKAVNAINTAPPAPPVATPAPPPVAIKPPKVPAPPKIPTGDIDNGLEKSRKHKKKKSRWPSFDVQSSEIARREGVSEKTADAMLASRARNHGTKKSLTGNVDENGFVIPGTVQRRSNVGFADMDRRASEIKARADAARVLAAADAAAATPVVPSGPRIRYGDPITEAIAGVRGKQAAREAGGTLAGREIRVYRPPVKNKRT